MENWTKVPGTGSRMSTGAIQFGEDWPGVFIRGDEAIGYGTMIDFLLSAAEQDEQFAKKYSAELIFLPRLAKLMFSCVDDRYRTGWGTLNLDALRRRR